MENLRLTGLNSSAESRQNLSPDASVTAKNHAATSKGHPSKNHSDFQDSPDTPQMMLKNQKAKKQ
jgi:hypothetical protein|tara:strand:+ start:540 stop:734 length:195 start_codon:yes stop_codon:yes gene_type:complete